MEHLLNWRWWLSLPVVIVLIVLTFPLVGLRWLMQQAIYAIDLVVEYAHAFLHRINDLIYRGKPRKRRKRR